MPPLQSKVTFKGLTKTLKELRAVRGRWPKEANRMTKRGAWRIHDLYFENLSGYKPSTTEDPLPVGVRTGTLRAGAKVKQVNQYRADIVNDVRYAGFIEDGTRKMAPRRPLRNAVEKYTDGELPNDQHDVVVRVWREALS
jgi:hypothetical protein